MTSVVETLLSFATSEERRNWLQQQIPSKDESLLDQLIEESYQRCDEDAHTALPLAEVVKDAASVWEDKATLAVGQRLEANARSLLGEHTASVELYNSSITLFRTVGRTLDAARAVIGQLDSLMALGNYMEALAQSIWALNEFRAAGDPLDLGGILVNRGNLFARLNRYPEALADFEEARALFALNDHQMYLAMVEANEANLLREMNDFRLAEARFKQARSHFEQVDSVRSMAHVNHNLSYLYFCQGDYQQALLTANQARSVFAAQDSAIDVAYVDLDRSEIYLALNLWQEAYDLASATYPVFEGQQMPWESARLWLNQAVALAQLGNLPQANLALAEAHTRYALGNHSVWLAIVELYQATFDLRLSRFETAHSNAEQARTVFTTAGLQNRIAECDVLLGQIALGQKEITSAERHFRNGLAQVDQLDLPAVLFACQQGLGQVRALQGDAAASLAHYRLAIDSLEHVQATIGAEDYKIAFRSNKLGVYQSAALLCLDPASGGNLQEAFDTIEKAKSRSLLDTFARVPEQSLTTLQETGSIETGSNKTGLSSETTLLTELASLKRELNWYYNRLNFSKPEDAAQTPESYAQLNKAISLHEGRVKDLLNRWRSPELVTAPNNPLWTISADELRASLPANTTLLEYFVTHDQVIVLGLSQSGLWSKRLPATRTDISERLAEFQFQLGRFVYGAEFRQTYAELLLQGTQAVLGHLYQLLVQPISAELTTEHLVIIPHDLLHAVPFHALYDGQTYLIEGKIVSYAPSATIFHRVQHLPETQNFAAPRIFAIDEASIPYARVEAEALTALFPTAEPYLGESATTDSFLHPHPQSSFLHVSSHALYRSDNPLFSALKMVDGWVTANEIRNLQVTASLVTLSACATGRTQSGGGDELLGLSRGFFANGTRSLVASQWNVDDTATAELMTAFYQQLIAGQSVCVALRAAQLKIFHTWKHPYYWAPFFLSGHPWLRLPSTTFA